MSQSVSESAAEPPEQESASQGAKGAFSIHPGERLAFTVILTALAVLSGLAQLIGPFAHSGSALIVITCVVALGGTLVVGVVLAINRRGELLKLLRRIPVPLMRAFAVLLLVGATGGVIGYLVGQGGKDHLPLVPPPSSFVAGSAPGASTGAPTPLPSPALSTAAASATSVPPPTPSLPSASSSPLPLASSAVIATSAKLEVQDPGGTGVYGVAFTSNSTFATGDSNGLANLWNVAQQSSIDSLPDRSGQAIYGISYSPHGNIIAADTSNAPAHNTGSVVLWDATSGNYIKTLTDPGTMGVGSPVAFSPDGGTLAASDADGGIYLWSAASYKLLDTFYIPSSKPNYEIAYSPTSGYLAVANGNGTAYLWNPQIQKIVMTFPDPDSKSQGLQGIAFSRDGSMLATGDNNGNAYLWNVAAGTLVAKLPGLPGSEVRDIAFSPSIGALATVLVNDNSKTYEFCIWNTAGELLATRKVPGSTGGTKAAFSPDGSLLAIGDTNDSTYVWDMSGLR